MTAVGKRDLNLFIGADVTFWDPGLEAERTVYWSNRSWITNPDDSVAANRQYIGLLLQAFTLELSWFSGDQIGGRSERNFGELRAFNPDGAHSLNYIFEDSLSPQGRSITYRIGEIGDDLADMITFTVEGRQVRPSDDGHEVIIDISDGGQALDTSILIDRFQGLGFCVRFAPGVTATIPEDAAFDPTTAWYLHIAYRLPSWTAGASPIGVLGRAASGGGDVCRLELGLDGGDRRLVVRSRTSADASVTLLCDDLAWVADGRWHQFVGKWDGAVLSAFHSTRTGGVKSSTTEAITTIKAGDGDLLFGDLDSTLATHEHLDVALVAFAVDGDVPTDSEIIARLKRALTDDEAADCLVYLPINNGSGTTATDESGNGHNATVPNTWQQTFEGRSDLQGQAKPQSWGRVFSAPVTWIDREEKSGAFHSRGYKGIQAIYEGANRLIVGWPKTQFKAVRFTAATKTISFDTFEAPTGVERLHAQPGMQGLVDGQEIVVAGTASNDGTYTVNGSSTERSIVVDEALTDESPVTCYLTALGIPSGSAANAPDVEVHFDAGAVLFANVPQLPVTAEALGDYGNETPTSSTSVWFPEFTAAIMRELLTEWSGIASASIADNWDVDPDNPIGAYWAEAGVWLDPNRDRTIRDVLDQGALTLWARWGQRLTDSVWDLYPIAAPAGTADLDLGSLEILSLRRVRSVPPIGGLTLRCAINYRPLQEGEVAGIADAATAAALRRAHLEAKPVLDPDVLQAHPYAETMPAQDTWLRNLADANTDAQRRYDVLKVEREMYDVEAILYGLNVNPLAALLTITDADFPTTVAGKDFHLVQVKANDEEVSPMGWG